MTTNFGNLSLDHALHRVFDTLERAASGSSHGFRLPCLATVDKDNAPRVRTVVLRHFFPEKRQCVVYTDKRSQKVEQIRHNDRAELCFWDRNESLQVRCQCQIELCDYNGFFDKTGHRPILGDGRDYSTLWPPGRSIDTEDVQHSADPQQNFCALICQIEELEWLYLSRKNIRARYSWDKDGQKQPRQSYLVP